MSNNFIAIISFDDGRTYKDPEEIKSQETQYESAMRITHSLIAQVSGEIVGHIKGDVVTELHSNQAEILKEIVLRIKKDVGLSCYIGVGEDTRQASIALSQAISKNIPIKVFTSDLNEDEKTVAIGEDDQINKAENYKPIENLDKDKLRNSVQLLAQNKNLFEQLKQSAPDMYSAVTAVAMSLAEILQADKEAKNNESQKMVDTVNKHLDVNNKKYKEEKEKILHNIIMQLIARDGSKEYYGDDNGDNSDSSDESDFDYDAPMDKRMAKTEEISKAEISDETKERVIESLRLISNNKDAIKALHQANPEAAEALSHLITSLGKIFQSKTGTNLNAEIDQRDIKDHLDRHNKEDKAPHVSTPKPIHRRLEFAPGAVREDSPQHKRRKTESGEWVSVTPEAKEGEV
jgi:hypothetical protein